VVLTVAGPRAAAVLRGLVDGGLPAEAWSHREASVAGTPALVVRSGLAPAEAWDLWLAAEAAEAAFAALTDAGAVEASFGDWEARRVERGVPRFGPDFGPDTLPQETGLEERAVSYDKGCYLGQEVVARIHYRGGVNKGLRGLDLGTAPPPAAGAEVLHDGRPAGSLGTAVVSPALGRTVALAILHQRAGEAGTEVEVAGAGPATVRDLPFVP
jgi:folate-binding protein YgfZ